MKQHTSDFKEEIKNLGRQLDSTLTFGNTTLSEELYSVTPSFEGAILKSVMKQLTIESSVDVPRETIVKYKLGLLVNGSYEYMDYGNYVVYSSEKEEDKNLYKILCYDKLLYSMIPYEGVAGTFPMTVREYLTAICNKLGITFADENTNFANYNRIIPADPYLNLDYTYRDVLDELAQVTASTICMNNNDEIEVRYIEEENAIYNTVEGTSLTITDADTSRKANIIEIQGNTIQDGTPSPDNEVEVQNVTGDNYIVVSNANLFNSNGISKIVSGVSLTNNNDGTYTANGTATTSVSIPLIVDPETIKLKANSSYIWSIEVLGGSSSGNVSFPVAVRKDDGTTIYNYLSVRPNTEKYSDKKTSTENLTLREVTMYVPNGVTINNLIFRLQLKEDTTATDYIEHQGKKYRVDFGGKNKFNTSQRTITWKSIVVEESSRKVVLKPEIATGSGYVRYTINNIKPSTNYVFSCEEIQVINSSINSKGQVYIREYNSSETMHYISVVNKDNLSRTFTTQSDTVKIGLDFYATTGAEADYENMQIRYIGIQLEEGTQKTNFSPYVENPIELCKIGTYQDYIYKSGNKWYTHKAVEKTKIDGSFTNYMSVSNRTNTTRFGICHLISNANNPLLCNRLSYNSSIYSQDVEGCWWAGGAEEILYLSVPNTIATTRQELKDWLAENNLLLYYPLEEPLEEEITNQSLIAQLEELKRIDMYDDLTYVDFDGNLDGIMQLKYFKGLEFDDVIDEEYLKDVNVNFAEKYGKINSIVLSRSGESDNVYLQDEESVEAYGLCELKIIDNQIMNNNDRSDYLPDILAQLDGLEYYINDFSSTGILYYDLCDRYGVKVGEKTYSCIMFNDEVNVTTGLEEFIYTDMPEQSQTDYTKADKTDRKINQTYLIVDKQNQKIESLITQIGDRSEKTTSITQDIDGINAIVQDIEDLSIEGETSVANLAMLNINQCEPITIQIHPILESIYCSYPRSNLYPSNQTFIRNRILRFVRTYIDDLETKTENIDYMLPDDLLWIDNETYDEFYLDYETKICRVTKRCGLDANGNIYKLSNEVVKNFDYPTILLGTGDYEIKIVNCQTAYIYAKLMKQNAITSQFATKVEVSSQIEQKADSIMLKVNEKVNQDDIIAQLNVAVEDGQGIVKLIGNQVIIDSDNFKLLEDGSMEANNGKFNGDVSLGKNNQIIVRDINEEPLSIFDRSGINLYSGGQYTGNIITTKYLAQDETQRGVGINLRDNGRFFLIGVWDEQRQMNLAKMFFSKQNSFGYGDEGFRFRAPIFMGAFPIYFNGSVYWNGYNTFTFYDDYQCIWDFSNGSMFFHNDASIYTSGKVYTDQALSSSDGRLKKNIEETDINALDIINQISHKKFDWKKDNRHTAIGYIAQELEEIEPSFVHKREIQDDNKKTIDEEYYLDETSILATATKAIQEQQEQIEELKKQIEYQNSIIEKLASINNIEMPKKPNKVKKTKAKSFVKDYGELKSIGMKREKIKHKKVDMGTYIDEIEDKGGKI